MNMLIGVLCEVVTAVGAAEKEEAAIRLMKQTILVELKKFDDDGNAKISRKELENLMQDFETVGVLDNLEIDVHYLLEMQQMFFVDPTAEVSIEKIMEQMLDCRKTQPTTVKHMVSQQNYTHWLIKTSIVQLEERIVIRLRKQWEQLESELRSTEKRLARRLAMSSKPAQQDAGFILQPERYKTPLKAQNALSLPKKR